MPWKANVKYLQPKIDYADVKRLWFAHAGHAYPVCTAPVDVFRAAVIQKAPKWEFHETYGPVLSQIAFDRHDRWWLLNSLIDDKRPISLYQSREAAEQACAEQVGS